MSSLGASVSTCIMRGSTRRQRISTSRQRENGRRPRSLEEANVTARPSSRPGATTSTSIASPRRASTLRLPRLSSHGLPVSRHSAWATPATRRSAQIDRMVVLRRRLAAASVEELGAVLEVHGVEVEPPAAPDESLGLEGVDDRLRHPVLPAALLPAPVVAQRR